jgi:hypothetical protein
LDTAQKPRHSRLIRTERDYREAVMTTLRGLLAVVCLGFGSLCQPASAALYTLSGELTAAQVVDGGGSTSTATGFGVVTIDTSLFTITTDLSWSGLSGPADRAHLHDAPAGASRLTPPNGDFFHEVLYIGWPPDPLDPTVPFDPQGPSIPCAYAGTCVPASGSSLDVLQLSATDGYGYPDFASLLDAFLADGVYLDVHTELYPSGEIRGQLVAAVPEPTGLGLLVFGLGLFLGVTTGSGRQAGLLQRVKIPAG